MARNNQTTVTTENSIEDADDNVSIIEYSEDISTAEAPEPLPVREYPATIQAVTRKTSSKGTAYAEVMFFVSPDNFPADFPVEEAPDGKTIPYRRVSLEDNKRARFSLRRFCEAIGAPMSNRIDLNEWVGLDATIHVDHDKYEGISRENITRVSAA